MKPCIFGLLKILAKIQVIDGIISRRDFKIMESFNYSQEFGTVYLKKKLQYHSSSIIGRLQFLGQGIRITSNGERLFVPYENIVIVKLKTDSTISRIS